MGELTWYRSLYWRIGLGFVALLATLLAVQGVLFLWLTGRASELLAGRSPAEYANTIASDVGVAMSENATLDIDVYLNGRYQTSYRPFVVVMRDGRMISSRLVQPPGDLSRQAMSRLMYGEPRAGAGPRAGGAGAGTGAVPVPPQTRSDPAARPDGAPPIEPAARPDPANRADPGAPGRGGRGTSDRPRDGFGRGRGMGPGSNAVFAPVMVYGETSGMVAVTTDPRPLYAVVRDLGPGLGIVVVGLLVAGTAIAALLIFRPTQRRLRSLQQAAIAIGAGHTSARAEEAGGDEVALLSHAFNDMAAGLEQRTQALMAADVSRRQLLADVSHELMTPLSAIRGYVETMAMADVKLDEPTRHRYLGIVADETERLEHIIGDLLDLARLEGGGGAWKREVVPIASLFERVHERHGPLLQSRHITLVTSIAPDAGEVTGDPNRLEQALQNLAANAVRHTPEGGRVTLFADRVERGVRLTVEDSGPGIPVEHLPHVFDRFYKVDVSRTGTPVPSGSGLGLSIVQAIVRRHGGTIAASNAVGDGARFEIVLPA